MKHNNLFWTGLYMVCLLIFTVPSSYAQDHQHEILPMDKGGTFYATMDENDALALKAAYPDDIEIYASENNVSAVKLTDRGGITLHHNILVHGPGYIQKASKADALAAVKKATLMQKQRQELAFSYTIDQDATVNQALDMVKAQNIEEVTKKLVSYGTRYHTTSTAKQSVQDMKARWESLASGRSDVSVRLFNHSRTNMPSAIMTIKGSTLPDEYVVIGGHIDSINPRNSNDAPGADDDASGIASITEAARVLLDMNFKPKRTIEIMAYAAEEVGLVGSAEIAEDYKQRNVNIVSYVQFDMTNYKGSSGDVYLSTDSYTDDALNGFLRKLMDHYNASGAHKLVYGTSACNYGCSDHYSWANEGYDVAFPFEAKFQESNPKIHTSGDTYDNATTPGSTHAAKFSKLALEFLIEVAKSADGGGGQCAIPSQLTISEITTNSAKASWSSVPSATNYTVRYRKSNSQSWTTVNSNSSPAQLGGLEPSTGYEVQVRANCSGGSSDYSSSKVFNTQGGSNCNPVTNFPYQESFESGTGAWEQGTTDDIDWTRNSNGTPSSNTGPSQATDGSYYLYTEASSPNYPSKSAELTSPCLDMSALSQPEISFSYHMYGSDMGSLALQVSENEGSTWSDLWSLSGDQGNGWKNAAVDLSSYKNVIKLRFVGTTGNSYRSDIAIDLVNLGEKSGDPISYCPSKGKDASEEWIGKVTLGSINNDSGNDSGYGNYTTVSTDIESGSAVDLSITPSWNGSSYKEGYSVWIDFDKNGSFDDAGEQVFSKSPTEETPVTGRISLPSNLSTGKTRMRVAMKYNGLPSPCENFRYGEVEDYSVNIVGRGASAMEKYINAKDVKNQDIGSFMLYANVTTNEAKIRMKEGIDQFELKLFTQDGREVHDFSHTRNGNDLTLSVQHLGIGTYFVIMKTNHVVNIQRLVKK